MDINTKAYYIAYFDVLGYKAFFEDNDNNISEFLRSNIELARDISRKTEKGTVFSDFRFTVKMFSDNFMILVEDTKNDDGYQTVKAMAYLLAIFQLRFLEKYRILVRGAITKGDAYINSDIVFGEGLIRAVTLEGLANFPRIILDKERLGNQVCDDLCEKCVSKDADDEYYINFFSILGTSVGLDDEYSNNVESHMANIRKNITALVKKHGKYNRSVKDVRKIAQAEKTISKYTWLLAKYNDFCGTIGEGWAISYSLELYYRLMKSEIHVG